MSQAFQNLSDQQKRAVLLTLVAGERYDFVSCYKYVMTYRLAKSTEYGEVVVTVHRGLGDDNIYQAKLEASQQFFDLNDLDPQAVQVVLDGDLLSNPE